VPVAFEADQGRRTGLHAPEPDERLRCFLGKSSSRPASSRRPASPSGRRGGTVLDIRQFVLQQLLQKEGNERRSAVVEIDNIQ